MSQAGMSCDYGSQKCCGEKYPEVTMTCDGSNWQGFHIDTICMMGK